MMISRKPVGCHNKLSRDSGESEPLRRDTVRSCRILGLDIPDPANLPILTSAWREEESLLSET